MLVLLVSVLLIVLSLAVALARGETALSQADAEPTRIER